MLMEKVQFDFNERPEKNAEAEIYSFTGGLEEDHYSKFV